ncbi:hypothetical protein EUX98_g1613 [Antrodiella citrinella]|uniref:DUF6533 domain-containing protein n=1 Tax=Antrodiella citrinella TaxID=2447956 RepID=A0A4S4N0Z2_9APHY|nr:hypothetical protein EUX98_g1613 [Antrodiella citrinella]
MPVPVLIEYVDIVASFSILLWDWVINIGDEIEYFWWGNGNWMKWFYFFLRYFPLMVEGYASSNAVLSLCKLTQPSTY